MLTIFVRVVILIVNNLKLFLLIKLLGVDGFCTESSNSNKCTKCKLSSYYLKSYSVGNCVISQDCAPLCTFLFHYNLNVLDAMQDSRSSHSINECVADCSDSTELNLGL